VEADRDAIAPAPRPAPPSVAQGSGSDLVRSGAELVALSERFYGGVFLGAVGFVGLAALAALVLLPVRKFPPGAPVAVAFLATGLLVAATLLAGWRAQQLYCALRRWPRLQLGLVIVAAALVASPEMSSALWWPSCAILMMLAVVVSLPRTLAYCLAVLGTNLAGHLVAADLGNTSAVTVIGLWIGYPLWILAITVFTDRLASGVLRVNAAGPPTATGREPPRRVPASASGPEPDRPPAPQAAEVVVASEGGDEEPAPAAAPSTVTTQRLTARQLQVVALLADGLRHREVAACLSISERQVQRHIADAVARLGLRSAYELAAVAVSEGIVPDAAALAPRG
jgi:DNA-binding CsgD family transcriptional regulator